ncbi:MAG: class I SAM-dependent methyltransferase, partial [Thermoplasmata archaeon]|nr:class I SAM-dependent methyltransferase [Thermoplasmata archaeon]
MEREWNRYQGTPQRDLFRELRERFLRRHAIATGRALEVGPGPGRFSPLVGRYEASRVLLDLSRGMLEMVKETWPIGPRLPSRPELVRGDGTHPPFRPATFNEVVALGNPLGFSGEAAEQFLSATLGMIAPGGRLLIETVAGSGESSRYLGRLPSGAVRRLLVAPVAAVVPRVEREGFRPEAEEDHRARRGFRRFGAAELIPRLARAGFSVDETIAVAPCLGAVPDHVAAIRPDPAAWSHLLEVEERLGRTPGRVANAAALLISAVRG